MKQTQQSIRKTIKELREIVEDKKTDPATARMAYFAETSLRWATEDTVDWKRPEQDLALEVELLKKETGLSR